jgi:hypothetical protein
VRSADDDDDDDKDDDMDDDGDHISNKVVINQVATDVIGSFVSDVTMRWLGKSVSLACLSENRLRATSHFVTWAIISELLF